MTTKKGEVCDFELADWGAHESRKKDVSLVEASTSCGSGFGDRDAFTTPENTMYSTFASTMSVGGVSAPGDLAKLMAVNQGMKGIVKMAGLSMREGIQDDFDNVGKLEQDKKLSQNARLPAWDFAKWKERGPGLVQKTHFQPGRYNVNLDAVRQRPKESTPFEGYLGREKKPANRDPKLAPPGMEVKEEATLVPDRSLFRLSPCLSSTRRVLSVSNMRDDLDRPDMNKRKKEFFDQNDPVVMEKVREQEMTFDRSAVETWNRLRTDMSPRMEVALARSASGLGHRIFQNDIGMRRMRQLKGDLPSTTSEAFLPIESAKEPRIARPRPDKGRTFEQMMGRKWLPGNNAHEAAKIGSLRKNKRQFSMSFERLPRRGFEKRCARVRSLSALSAQISGMRHGRSYEALPEWEAEALGTEAEAFPLALIPARSAPARSDGLGSEEPLGMPAGLASPGGGVFHDSEDHREELQRRARVREGTPRKDMERSEE